MGSSLQCLLLCLLPLLLLLASPTSSIFGATAGAGTLTLTIPALNSLTQTQLLYLTAGGLSLAAAGGLGALAVASRFLSDGASGGSGGGGYGSGYSAPEYHVVEENYIKPSSGYGHSRKAEQHKETQAESHERSKFTYQWEENIARLRRGKRGVAENINRFIEVKYKYHFLELALYYFIQTIEDKSDCGKMYLCEISAMDPGALTQFEGETVQMMKKTYKVKERNRLK